MTKKKTNLSDTLSEAVSVATSVAYTRQEIQKLKTEFVSLLEKKTTEVIVEQVPGPVGLRGALGATGAQGSKGDKGDKGDVGERGENDAVVIAGGIRINPSIAISETAISGSATLPNNPVGFISVNIGGTDYLMPYYNA